MGDVQLTVAPRELRGKRVRFLRREGWLPANIYGQGEPSVAVQVMAQDIGDLLRHGGGNQLCDLVVDGKPMPHPVVIRRVQRDPVTRGFLHVDFLRVSLTAAMTATVPLVFVGESPAIKNEGGTLVQSLNAVTVSALPGNVPQQIEVDLAFFNEMETTLHVSDLVAPPKVEIVADGATAVAKVAAPRLREEAEEEAAAVAVAREGAPPTEAVAGPAAD